MLAGLKQLIGASPVAIDVVDVDDDADLEARFDVLVPVLEWQGAIVCYHFLDADKVREILTCIR